MGSWVIVGDRSASEMVLALSGSSASLSSSASTSGTVNVLDEVNAVAVQQLKKNKNKLNLWEHETEPLQP